MARPEIGDRITTRLPPDLLQRVEETVVEYGTSRAGWLREAVRDALSIQAPRHTEARRRSPTELARIVARDSGWRWDGEDQVLDEDGTVVGYTIEDVAAAMQDLDWFAPAGSGLLWGQIPPGHVRGVRSSAIRARLRRGRHPSVNGPAR